MQKQLKLLFKNSYYDRFKNSFFQIGDNKSNIHTFIKRSILLLVDGSHEQLCGLRQQMSRVIDGEYRKLPGRANCQPKKTKT